MSLRNKPLNTNLITDNYVKKNFEILQDEFLSNPFLKGAFKFFEINIENTAAGTYKIPHGLGFKPKDVLLTSYLGTVPTFNYTEFDATNIVVVTTGQVLFRAFIGTYSEE